VIAALPLSRRQGPDRRGQSRIAVAPGGTIARLVYPSPKGIFAGYLRNSALCFAWASKRNTSTKTQSSFPPNGTREVRSNCCGGRDGGESFMPKRTGPCFDRRSLPRPVRFGMNLYPLTTKRHHISLARRRNASPDLDAPTCRPPNRFGQNILAGSPGIMAKNEPR
jgi:hypothetical protein